MKNISVKSVDYLLDSLKILADNPYALLWELVEDFKCNGHEISVKSSTQYQQIVIDHCYQHIGGIGSITSQYGVTYKNPLDYIRDLLTDNLANAKETSAKESLDFGKGTKKEIREALAQKVSVNESNMIKIYSEGSDEYKKLEIAAQMMSLYSGKKYYVGVTYFDYGQDWKWTTILEDSDLGGQALYPKDYEDILFASNAAELGKAVQRVLDR